MQDAPPSYSTAFGALAVSHGDHVVSANALERTNACVVLCDGWTGEVRVALRVLSSAGRVEELSFDDLRISASRFAAMLAESGVGPGDRVAGLLPRTLDLMTVLLGTLGAGAPASLAKLNGEINKLRNAVYRLIGGWAVPEAPTEVECVFLLAAGDHPVGSDRRHRPALDHILLAGDAARPEVFARLGVVPPWTRLRASNPIP
ncbi:AMP-binding protein [Sphingobium boeckii]|uniref:AMP-dependent synthetase/ligase domain-containing protein n=1 Tax=Sphingobium boeckii TaxID=1082345 RepID=A0A7W9EED4_9SPHN|nr:AMP-binding protein [Sphingobium boeckii]MBB5684890.1 hypothetical protein [Sphingobium boeckii]